MLGIQVFCGFVVAVFPEIYDQVQSTHACYLSALRFCTKSLYSSPMHELPRFGMHLTHNTTRYICPTSKITCRVYSIHTIQSSSVWENTRAVFPFRNSRYSSDTASVQHVFALARMSSRCQNTGVPVFHHSGRNDRCQHVDRGSCFARPFLQTVAVSILL